ncbi:MAG: peptide ABC transporter permease [Ferrovum sp. 37-45-19]|nr:MAG: peptide ABC transporter permease [Ferrovum sp. 21-44-67]OYV94146.1 MAG: peptide ABC transporter permease [Ferrovum sp. 37-45-19]OZB34322.1 MAG: peptide ABC transporter permease [Ferrovum sp. 34-44-207]HQT81413.1 ABC transporter permease [Ferrovaceae bacterium]HQU06300.1 ABC transporter permease [Ferrovaceae bacterium]
MAGFIVRRVLQMIPTLLGVILLVFFLFNAVGGDPAYILAGKMASAEDIANIRHQLGTDQPVYIQLEIFIRQIVTGNFGDSWATHESVAHIFKTRLTPSLILLIPMMIIETLTAVGLALLVSVLRGSFIDQSLMVISTVMMSISLLVYIIVGQYLFASMLGWFPVKGWSDSLWRDITVYAPLPILLGLMVSIAPSLRLYRTFILDEINQDYVRTARAKGLTETRVLFTHVLKNAAIPILTNLLMGLPGLLTGAFLLERFFAIPGIGREIILAVERSDFPIIKAATVYVAVATMLANLLADILYRYLDPRVNLK